jgi:putative Ca2+/H+ antiporter (TMEM165/GDT1 family)
MFALLASATVVAIAEIGDKTQLLSLVLAARYRRPLPIVLAIALATLANHALAAWLGGRLAHELAAEWRPWLLGLSFGLIALWVLRPDKLEGEPRYSGRLGVFGASLAAFFIAEMGDKTQIATIALAARYTDFVGVLLGTTLGMLVANVPVVLMGERITRRLPLTAVRWLAAGIFAVSAIAALLVPGA